jgi:hypothetical protein
MSKSRMVYAASKDALKRSLNGLAEYQASDEDDIEHRSVLYEVIKFRKISFVRPLPFNLSRPVIIFIDASTP